MHSLVTLGTMLDKIMVSRCFINDYFDTSDAPNQASTDDNCPSYGGTMGYVGSCFGKGATKGHSDNQGPP